MKKLIFLFAFAFFGQQAFSQIYMVALHACDFAHPSNCNTQLQNTMVLTKVDPTGNVTYTCFPYYSANLHQSPDQLITLNQELNNIIRGV